VTEIDAAGECTFGFTDAPESYDGFGTLSLGVKAGERVVAIALSGAVKGCYPSAVAAEEVERDVDQAVALTGAAAVTLRRK
jgi:Fe-S cluster biogenesis protein NfuA